MRDLKRFTVCIWETTHCQRQSLEATRRAVWEAHPGAGVVETCQRIEAFSLVRCHCGAPLRLSGRAALEHLASLAAGLESAVLGEYQVLGQVRAGLAPLRPHAPWLDAPIAAARQLRAEAAFTATTGHLLDAALRLTESAGRGSLLVVGAGAAGRDVARRAVALGFAEVTIASRQAPPAIPGVGGWIAFGRLSDAPPSDVVVTCLGSAAEELSPGSLPAASLYVDLGSPPNLAESVAPSIGLHAIVTSLRADSAELARRTALRLRLNELLAARVAASAEDAESPVVRIRREAEAIRQRETARISRLHPDLPPQTVDTITRALVNQLLHAPSERLRQLDDPELASRLAELFVPKEELV